VATKDSTPPAFIKESAGVPRSITLVSIIPFTRNLMKTPTMPGSPFGILNVDYSVIAVSVQHGKLWRTTW
jgi:hypothetical protein